MRHCNLHCSRIEHGQASRRVGSLKVPPSAAGGRKRERDENQEYNQTWLYAVTHRRDVTFCVSICMLNLPSPSPLLQLWQSISFFSPSTPGALSPSPSSSLSFAIFLFDALPLHHPLTSFSRICFTGEFPTTPPSY